MSVDPLLADVQSFRYGFLAASLHEVLDREVGSALSTDELRQLGMARAFLDEVVAGASLVAKGETNAAVSPTAAVSALQYALGPIEALQRVANDEELLSVFTEMRACVDATTRAGRLSGPVESLRMTASLFRFLTHSVISTVAQRQHVQVNDTVLSF